MSLEEVESADEGQTGALEGTRGRGETKARKALSKLGLKKVEGINRVVLRRPKGVLFVISNPEVFKSPNSECYVVYGEAKIEDSSTNGGFGNTQQLAQAEELMAREEQAAKLRQSSVTAAEEEEEEGEADATGLDEADIDVVMGQANCSRAKACRALKAADGDLVQAILDAN